MRAVLLTCTVICCALLAAAPAQAGTLSHSGDDLVFQANAGEENSLTITENGFQFTVTDQNQDIVLGSIDDLTCVPGGTSRRRTASTATSASRASWCGPRTWTTPSRWTRPARASSRSSTAAAVRTP